MYVVCVCVSICVYYIYEYVCDRFCMQEGNLEVVVIKFQGVYMELEYP